MISLDGHSLTLTQFRQVVEGRTKVSLAERAKTQVARARKIVDEAAKTNTRVYSINTGFGFLSKVTIDSAKLDELQVNLIRSHCAGVGQPLTETESRALLLLRANVLAKGYSGVRVELVEALIALLNHEIHPVIPAKGSVGASGDLAPLAHLAAVLIGEGEAFYQGKRVPGAEALKAAGLSPIKLAPKEGLSLINGTQFITGLGALVLFRAEELADLSDLICSASLDGVLGTSAAYADWLQKARAYPGQAVSAARMSALMQGSEIAKSHADCDRVQDPYSFRCAPQVHGASRELFSFVRRTLEIEINSATDNPLVNADTGELVSNGNFHGQPVAFAMDILAMGLSELASLSERRIAKLIDPGFSSLPAFLVKNEGLNSGFMMPHVTAAALVNENKVLCHPASVDSIPTSNEKEDHVSMGATAARKAKSVLENCQYVLAIEALAACQALDMRKPLKAGIGGEFLRQFVRKDVPTVERDRYFHIDIEKIASQIHNGQLHQAAEKAKLWA